MMIRFVSAAAGVISAGTTAAFEVAAASPPPVAFAWSAIAGIAGAGVTYGVLTNKVNSAHAKIASEKADRIQAVSELRADVHRGFDGIERRLEEQTRTITDAMSRMLGDR
jgi:hypothetical protein